MRASTAHILEVAGFQVLEAKSGEEALALLDLTSDVTVLVTDHLMPGMDGTQLVRQAQAARPNLRCLVVSGYADVEGVAADLPRLNKPFKAAELTEALAKLGV